MSTESWSGTLHLARDFALLDGHVGATDAHAHYAHQLLISPAAPIEVRIDGRAQQGHRALIPSMQAHAIVAAPAAMLTIYIEPLAIALEDLATLDPADGSAPALLQALLALPRRPLSDARVTTALAEVDALLDGKVNATTIAQRVQLSLSQLERLFAAHVGIPIRRLVKWRRLRLALSLALAGETLTAAAHEAGFADSAHFSRVMREMFGVRADRTLAGLSLRLLP